MDVKYVYDKGRRKYQFSVFDPYTRKYFFEVFKEIKFDNSYCFIYSERPGTPAANLKDDTPAQVKTNVLKH